MVKQDLKILGLLTLGFTLSIFLTVSGLASVYPSVRQKAQQRQIPFILIGEPEKAKESEKSQILPTIKLQESKKLENLEQVQARLFSTRTQDLAIADLNKDGIVNITDYLLAKKILDD